MRKIQLRSCKRSLHRLFASGLLVLATLGWATLGVLSTPLPAIAQVELGNRLFRWPEWSPGFDIGPKALGRFGRGSNLNSPPGDLIIHASGHYWYDHTFGGFVYLGFGLTGGMEYGIGVKLNLLEFIEDPTGETFARGIHRGVLGRFLQNFMVFVGIDYIHYSFKPPDPAAGQDYEASAFVIQPNIGAQWYIGTKTTWARRFYIETTMGYFSAAGSNYFVPYLGVGVELR